MINVEINVWCNIFRAFTTSSVNNNSADGSWVSKIFVRKIEPTKESHSRMLSDKEIIYALHTHNVRPGKLWYNWFSV